VSGDGPPDFCGRGGGGLYCGINHSVAGVPHKLAGDEFTIVQPQMSDSANWGARPERLQSLMLVDIDGDGRKDVCGLNDSGYPDFVCALSRSTPTGAAFDSLVVRTRNVASVDAIVMSGHIYKTGMGFCWRLIDGSINCSAPW
jgi:hypothetical protein